MRVAVAAGQLRHQVTIVQPAATQGSMGGAQDGVDQTQAFATVWAAVEPLSAKELFQGQQNTQQITTRITIRYLAGVNAGMQVQFGNVFYSIVAAINPEMRNVYLELLCVERDDSVQ